MRSTPFLTPFLTAITVLATSVLHAQSMQDWSAIEVATAGKSARLPSTVAVSGPAAGLLPNATQPVSGAHLKSESSPLVGVLATLTQLRPVRFTFLPGQGETGPQYGLLPGDLARLYPELVRTNLMTGTQTINTAQLTPLLVEAIKEMHGQLLALQQQLVTLQGHQEQQLPPTTSHKAPPAAYVPAFLRGGRAGRKADSTFDLPEYDVQPTDSANLE